jgi:septal ring factor EnvC (AmiA/AmiB activator)
LRQDCFCGELRCVYCEAADHIEAQAAEIEVLESTVLLSKAENERLRAEIAELRQSVSNVMELCREEQRDTVRYRDAVEAVRAYLGEWPGCYECNNDSEAQSILESILDGIRAAVKIDRALEEQP